MTLLCSPCGAGRDNKISASSTWRVQNTCSTSRWRERTQSEPVPQSGAGSCSTCKCTHLCPGAGRIPALMLSASLYPRSGLSEAPNSSRDGWDDSPHCFNPWPVGISPSCLGWSSSLVHINPVPATEPNQLGGLWAVPCTWRDLHQLTPPDNSEQAYSWKPS